MVFLFLLHLLPLLLLFLSCFFFFHSQALDWLQETGEQYLSTHTSPGETTEKTQELLKDYEEFRVSAKVH